MKREKILITGGAGFIGSNIAKKLINEGHQITIFDNFNPQVHGKIKEVPVFLKQNAKVVIGDVTNINEFYSVLENQNIIVHLAAETGTGQSMYEIKRYSLVNIYGTSVLCDFLINRNHDIEKVILASSRAIYGEGKYLCSACGIVYPDHSPLALMKKGIYDPPCPICLSSDQISALPTDEDSKINPTSIYGITKQVQEQMIMMTARTIGIDSYSLRFQNVYGPGQSLINPYTGILSIFSQLARRNEEIQIFEDGNESRDFVFIDDVVLSICKCIVSNNSGQFVLNIGSGEKISVLDVAKLIKRYLNSKSSIKITGAFREGDIRHNYADIRRARDIIEYEPNWSFAHGLENFLNWVDSQDYISTQNNYNNSLQEMTEKGLLHH